MTERETPQNEIESLFVITLAHISLTAVKSLLKKPFLRKKEKY